MLFLIIYQRLLFVSISSCLNQLTFNNLQRPKDFNISAFKNTLANSPWDTAFVFDDINDVLATWEAIFFQAIDQHAPTKQKRIAKSKQPQWINGDILNQLKIRDNLLSKARKSKTNPTNAWKQYRIARNLASNMIERKEIISNLPFKITKAT